MATKAQTLYLVDSHAQLYRAYHAVDRRMLAADRKTPTNAVFGFANTLKMLKSRFKPDLLAAIFDPHGPVLREDLYEEYREKLGPAFSGYKSHRDAMPDDLSPQIDLALELCVGYGIPAIQMEGYEADDVLGTLALLASKQGLQVVIVSGDKDLLQLVCDGIKVYDPMKDIFYDEDTVYELKGVKPCQVVDWLGFRGDSTDNIPGVTGVGDQTAVKLLQEHGSMDAALEFYRKKFEAQRDVLMKFVAEHEADSALEKERRAGIKPPKGVKVVEAYLFAQAERAIASRELAKLTLNLPLTLDLEQFRVKAPDLPKLVPLLKKLDFKQALKDLNQESLALFEAQAAAEAPASSVPDKPKTDYIVLDEKKKFDAFCKELGKQKRIAIDTETTGTDPRSAQLVGISISWKAGEAYYIPVRGPMGCQVLQEKETLACLKDCLEDSTVGKIGHHIKYDIQVLRGCGVDVRGIYFDTMIAGWLLDPGALRLNLEQLSYHYLGIRKTETSELIGKGKKQITMDLVPVADVGCYACGDVDCTWQLAQKLEPMLEEAGLLPLMRNIEVPLISVLADMEWTGIKVDGQLLRNMSKSLEAQLSAQEVDIYSLAGEKFNINSTGQLAAVLFEKLGLTSRVKTATGRDSTSEEVLTQLAREHELPRRILEYRGMLKLKNTYVDLLPSMISPRTGRIHATFQQTGAETGRLSSSDPNLQNIPVRSELGRSIRAAFRPGSEGWKIVTADYSQIELRVLAHYSQDKVLMDSFARGIDIHTAVAARLNGVKEDQVSRQQRSQAKAVNFGIIYGQTAFGLAGVLSISRQEAQKIIDSYFANHPGVRRCIDEIIARACEQGYVTTVLGRRRFVPQLKASDRTTRALGERLAVNTVFQGSAADLIKKAMIEIFEALNDGWKAKMLLQIHDELLFEAPPDEAEDLGGLVKKKMEGALKLDVPLVVDVGIGDDWLSAKD
ncbi:MAG TPA: DNA polymerase I [Planctomycetota bacterium]|nr:DNA polymerase I [Planctomycetota bacterium]